MFEIIHTILMNTNTAASVKPDAVFTMQEFHQIFLTSRMNLVEACQYATQYMQRNPGQVTNPGLRVSFGKYKGLTVDEIVQLDRPYLEYMSTLTTTGGALWMETYHPLIAKYLKEINF